GPAVVPGKPEESLLLKAIRYEDHEMPPAGKLPAAVIADVEAWIRQGAADPRDAPAETNIPKRADVTAAKQQWAFRPPQPHPAPRPPRRAWPGPGTPPVHPGAAERAGHPPRPPARPPHLGPPRHVRPDRPAADAGGSRGVHQ